MSSSKPGVLALEDGSIFRGLAFGADATIAGECVFNTSMTGYQEIITDPSYFGQIVTMTAVQIGNYGLSPEDDERARHSSEEVSSRGLRLRREAFDLPQTHPPRLRCSGVSIDGYARTNS